MKKSSLIIGSFMGLVIMTSSVMAATTNMSGFSDVPDSHWGKDAVKWSKEAMLVEGYKDGTFLPNNPISRVEMVQVLSKYHKMMEAKMMVMTDKMAAMEKKMTDMEVKMAAMEKGSTVNTVQGEEWDIIKKHVLANYPISEAYFDEHFKFVSSTSGLSINGDYDYKNGKWSTILTDVTRVNYMLTLEDAEDNKTNFDSHTRIYLHDNKVLEAENMPANLSEAEKDKFIGDTYEFMAPTHELKILLSKAEVLDLIKSTPECVDEKWFDVEAAEDNLALEFLGGDIYWNWEDNLSYCRFDAETKELIDMTQSLPD